ncbi:MAG: ComEC/Rec2 family competence protein [Mesorhizobium sp.]
MGCGALGYFHATSEPDWIQLALWVAVSMALARATRSRPVWHFLAIAAALVALGALLAKVEVYRAGTKILGGEISTQLTGDILNVDYLANGRVRLVLRVVKTERPTLRYQPDVVRLSTAKPKDTLWVGARISGVVKLHPPSGPVLPGGYDFSFESYFDGIGANGYFLTSPRLVASTDSGHLFASLENVRNRIAERIRSAVAGPEGEIAAALIVGVRAGIPEEINDSLRRTGLAHILSISGLHMALVAGIAMGGLRCMLALSPNWASRHSTKKYAAFGALLLVFLYLLISGGDVAAQRSFVMLAIMLFSMIVDRRALSMRNLAIAAVIVLVISPHEIVGPSFQMSFAATAALVGAYSIWATSKPAWMARMRPHKNDPLVSKILRSAVLLLFGTISTALIAGFATAIFGAWHFQRVSPLSLFANLAVSPIVSIIVMPFSLLAMMTMPFGLERYFLLPVGEGLSAMIAISDWLSARSPFDAVGLIPGVSVVWLTGALLAATIPTTRLRRISPILALAGIWTMVHPTQPDILVSEDAQLIAMRGDDGTVLLNKRLSNSFTLDAWKRALVADYVTAPTHLLNVSKEVEKLGLGLKQNNQRLSPKRQIQEENLSQSEINALLTKSSPKAFLCAGSFCIVEHRSGAIIVIAINSSIPPEICAVADLIILQVPNKGTLCPRNRATIVDSVSLARKGVAAIHFSYTDQLAVPKAEVDFAIAEPYRPWHSQRAFSRAARGLPPYKAAKRKIRPIDAAGDNRE